MINVILDDKEKTMSQSFEIATGNIFQALFVEVHQLTKFAYVCQITA